MDDAHLLRTHVTERSEDAFRALVRRHIAVVHGVARRQAGIDAHLADDVTQRLFVLLAQKAERATSCLRGPKGRLRPAAGGPNGGGRHLVSKQWALRR